MTRAIHCHCEWQGNNNIIINETHESWLNATFLYFKWTKTFFFSCSFFFYPIKWNKLKILALIIVISLECWTSVNHHHDEYHEILATKRLWRKKKSHAQHCLMQQNGNSVVFCILFNKSFRVFEYSKDWIPEWKPDKTINLFYCC